METSPYHDAQIYKNSITEQELTTLIRELEDFIRENETRNANEVLKKWHKLGAVRWPKDMDIREALPTMLSIFKGETSIPVDPKEKIWILEDK